MSNQRFSITPARAVSDKNMPDGVFRTLSALGIYGDRNGWCFPSLSTLAKDRNVSKAAISQHVKWLKENGYLNVHARYNTDEEKVSRRSNRYQIKFDYNDTEQGGVVSSELATPLSPELTTLASSELNVNALSNAPKDIDLPKLRKEAQERKTKQRANKKDTIDFLLAESRKIEPRLQMRIRVESALRGRRPDWDAPRSVWNGYDLVLMKREEETGETIERFMEWFYEDDFRATSDIYLQPKKINDWWSRAFTDETEMRPEYKKFVAEEIKSVPNPKA